MMPTTTPAAMAALFVPPPLDLAAAVELPDAAAVTTMVCPPTVTTEGFAVVVDEVAGVADDVGLDIDEGEEEETESAFGALVVVPVR